MHSMQANLIWRDDGTDYLTQTDAQKERRYVGPDYYSFPKRQNDGPSRSQTVVATALPMEDAVRLANETGMDLWHNLPADMLDGRAEAIGLYVRDHLDPALRVYWEYGNENENWNGAPGFNSHAYVAAQGRWIFPDLPTRPLQRRSSSRSIAGCSCSPGCGTSSPKPRPGRAMSPPSGPMMPRTRPTGRSARPAMPRAIRRPTGPAASGHRSFAGNDHHRHGRWRLFRRRTAGSA